MGIYLDIEKQVGSHAQFRSMITQSQWEVRNLLFNSFQKFQYVTNSKQDAEIPLR